MLALGFGVIGSGRRPLGYGGQAGFRFDFVELVSSVQVSGLGTRRLCRNGKLRGKFRRKDEEYESRAKFSMPDFLSLSFGIHTMYQLLTRLDKVLSFRRVLLQIQRFAGTM
jgi:hypothetical protein